MVIANTLVWWLGPWWSPVNAFFLIGLDLTMRDILHERIKRWQAGRHYCAGGAITWLLNPGAAQIAIASAIAFVVAAGADWSVYTLLRDKPWAVRVNGSNVVGAAVDSFLFPTLAFGLLLPWVIALQFFAKVAGGALWAFVLGPLIRRSA